MPYFVKASRGWVYIPGVSVQAFETLDDALNQACSFLAISMPIVRIETADGKFIEGENLAACCRGEKTLNDDLSST